MPQIKSADGRYLCADQGRNSFVLYDTVTGAVLWDRWAHEGGLQNAFPEDGAPPSHSLPGPPPNAPPTHMPAPAPGLPTGRVIRVTDARDGDLTRREMSYWSQAWIGPDGIYVFAGHRDGATRFFRVEWDESVTRLPIALRFRGEAEGWSWNSHGEIYLCYGPQLLAVNPFNGAETVVLDISDTHPGCQLFQAHASEDDRTYSATVQQIVSDGAYPKIGTVVSRHGERRYFPARDTLDESAIAGDYLVIKEGVGPDNRIINLNTWDERILLDADGAMGHSGTGHNLMIGEANLPDPGCCCVWDLTRPLTLDQRIVLFPTGNMGYVSDLRGDRCVHSGDTHLSLVALDGSGLTPLVEHHAHAGNNYDLRVKGNISQCGRVLCYTTGRPDVYIVLL